MAHHKYCVISGVFFSLVAVAHLLRIVYGLPIQVDEYSVPMLVSWIATIVPGGLAIWAFSLSRKGATRL